MKRAFTICAAVTLSFASLARAQDVPAEYQQVLTTLGKQGDYKANVLKVNIPRNDISVTVANVKTPTPFGFGMHRKVIERTSRTGSSRFPSMFNQASDLRIGSPMGAFGHEQSFERGTKTR